MEKIFIQIVNAFELYALKFNWLIKYDLSEDNKITICTYQYDDGKTLYRFKLAYNSKNNKIKMLVNNNRLKKEIVINISSIEDFILFDGITLHVKEFMNNKI